MTDRFINLNRWQRDRLATLVSRDPGLTVDQYEAAARVLDRDIVRPGLISLVSQRVIRRDDNGRLWPIA